MNKKMLVVIAYVVAVLFVVLAFIYFTTPANQLPSFIPGHAATEPKIHFKHGLAALFLGLGSVAYAWFQGGPKNQRKKSSDDTTPNPIQ